MKNFKKYIYILAAISLTVACKPTIEVPASSAATAGSLDLTRYIAVGNSLTAGYSNNGLYLVGQYNSYPIIIAKQMQSVNSNLTFSQPLFTDAQANGSGYQKLTGFNADGTPIIASVPPAALRGSVTIPGVGTFPLFTKYTGTGLDNYGVPGIKLNDIENTFYGNVNPYMERMFTAASPTINTDYLDLVTSKSFTFFTNWLGNNDALAYATSGGASDALTDKATFNTKYTTLINSLTAKGAKGACVTIPDVTTIPYFNTVTVGAILAGVQKVAPTVPAIWINAKVTNSPLDNAHAPRAATAADLITLTFLSGNPNTVGAPAANPYGLSQFNPIDDKYVLDANEAAIVKDYVSSYNTSIKTIAASKGLAVFDAFAFLTNVKANGLLINGISLNSGYISGGIFSLDGVHLTPRGYSIVANEFIKAINSTYNSSIPLANVSTYNGVIFP